MAKITQDILQIELELLEEISSCDSLRALEAIRKHALGRKGLITAIMKEMAAFEPDLRREIGSVINDTKSKIQLAIEAKREVLNDVELNERLLREKVDVTLPSLPELAGRIHPIMQVTDEIVQIFSDMGFTVAEGPDIEDDFHNFTALNIPLEHPARQMQDTFYLHPQKKEEEPMVLRTHTSPVQIRTMRETSPPHRIVVPGRTYRSDSDQTHTPMFHQIEGLVIDKDIHMGHLKGTLESFCEAFFEIKHVKMRFRPSHFPFTEPSAEVDIGCHKEGGQLKIGDGEDWLEILGCGMVHPKVLESCGLDPNNWQGFAWGMGIDRIAMLKYGIPDLRAFFECDVRWLKHYGFVPLDFPTLGGGLSR